MSVLLERSMGELNEGRRAVYPLFEKGSKPKDTNTLQVADELKILPGDELAFGSSTSSPGRPSKRSTASGVANCSTTTHSQATSNTHKAELEVDLNDSRRKRQRTASLDGGLQTGREEVFESRFSLEFIEQLGGNNFGASFPSQATATATNWVDFDNNISWIAEEQTCNQLQLPNENSHGLEKSPPNANISSVPRNELSESVQAPAQYVCAQYGATLIKDSIPIYTEPKKVLKLNLKTGTFGSPPPKIIPSVENKLKKSSRAKQPKSKLVIIRYGPETGPKIDHISKGNSQNVLPKQSQATTNPRPEKKSSFPPKSMHPLFSAKNSSKTSNTYKPSPKSHIVDLAATSSPTKLKSITSSPRPSIVKAAAPLFSGFGSGPKVLKIPGALEPAWPWKGMLHVRGNECNLSETQLSVDGLTKFRSKAKKSKGNAINVLATEDILEILAESFHLEEVKKCIQHIDLDEHPLLLSNLRPSVKFNKSGTSIQQRMRKELRTKFPLNPSTFQDGNTNENDVSLNDPKNAPIHPALVQAYGSIANTLSAFDKGQCETQAWTSKYSPSCAAEVLQSGDEAILLKRWLQTLTVNAVEVAGGQPSSQPKKIVKRKRKPKRLDGFVVSSDEDDFLIQKEVSESESEICPPQTKKTIIRTGVSKTTGKMNNAILLSGPHGCGKTAAVYAVAKELGFEVFEINSGSRRSGKDITDKVGDMTRNHLVQRSRIQLPVIPVDADEKRLDDALADDLKSGRQGTMNTFFKPKMTAPAPPELHLKPKPRITKIKFVDSRMLKNWKGAPQETKQSQSREQKQSLILIEEVDIIYKEDTQFWPTIVGLIQTSKRPIIMTCSDESVIDLSQLSLHGVLRLTPPPVDIAVDYMLLVAACEGHVLERPAVHSLYETRKQDLRASLTELNYWCQFGVGSVKGGLDWFYSRFPSGSDCDEYGNTIRVVSEGAYQLGMGCFSQDVLESHVHRLDIEEQTLHQAWDEWQLDTADWQENSGVSTWAEKLDRNDFRTSLFMYEDFAETMSDADLCSHGALASDLKVTLSTTTLTPSSKTLDDYVLPHKVVDSSQPLDSRTSIRDLSLWLRSRARSYLHVNQHIKHDWDIPTELDRLSEKQLIQLIRQQYTEDSDTICRSDFYNAFEPLANPEKAYVWSVASTPISIITGSLTPIVEDLAPYVRSIVAYDSNLAKERIQMSNLLSEGGIRGKRMRTTRAALSALEGSVRKTTRREKYFQMNPNPYLVMRTGMRHWMDASIAQTAAEQAAIYNAEQSQGSRDGSEEFAMVGNDECKSIDGQVGRVLETHEWQLGEAT